MKLARTCRCQRVSPLVLFSLDLSIKLVKSEHRNSIRRQMRKFRQNDEIWRFLRKELIYLTVDQRKWVLSRSTIDVDWGYLFHWCAAIKSNDKSPVFKLEQRRVAREKETRVDALFSSCFFARWIFCTFLIRFFSKASPSRRQSLSIYSGQVFSSLITLVSLLSEENLRVKKKKNFFLRVDVLSIVETNRQLISF